MSVKSNLGKGLDLHNKRVLVTGGAVRIGKAIALALADAGCDVCVHFGKSQDEAQKVVTEIALKGRKGACFVGDLLDPDAPSMLRMQIEQSFGPLDILINNASYWPEPSRINAEHDLLNESVSNWDRTLAVNARAPFFLIQELAGMLGRDGKGVVVNLLDQSITSPYCDRAAHTVSKWALAGVTHLAAKTLAPSIRVVGIELGPILPGEEMSDSEVARRQWGGVEVVTETVLFVLRNEFVSGEIIGVKGDGHLRRR